MPPPTPVIPSTPLNRETLVNRETPITPEIDPPLALKHASLDWAGIAHGFFTRDGGVSTGLYKGLNIGIGSADAQDAVMENRRRAALSLGVGGEALATVYQVHGKTVVPVTEAHCDPAMRPKADAMVTDRVGIALGIATADCAPVLFADIQAQVIGACHAGWKGAYEGVVMATVDAMVGLGADRSRIVGVLGPCIHQPSYEVGPEFQARLVAADPENAQFFVRSQRPEHFQFDLPGYVLSRMALSGLRADRIGQIAADTYPDERRFYSYRRATHRDERGPEGGIEYGRLLSAIALTPTPRA